MTGPARKARTIDLIARRWIRLLVSQATDEETFRLTYRLVKWCDGDAIKAVVRRMDTILHPYGHREG